MPQDPRHAEPKQEFPRQQQSTPGSEARMSPRPDFGEASYRGHGRLQDRVALITGGDSGIGRAVALAFAREGAHVAIAYLDEHEDAEETKRLVEAADRKALLVAGDLAEEALRARAVRETVERYSRLDVLVNNAAFQGRAVERFEDLDPERVERTFRVNIVAMFSLVRHALPHLRPGASIINTSSVQAYHPNPQILDYAATKGAIRTFTQGLAQELTGRRDPRQRGRAGADLDAAHRAVLPGAEGRAARPERPMERAGQPAEVAPVFVFLASDEARYVSGEVLGVTGGSPLA
ncbi:MAG: SDR family oxidoreductase [Anaeromyxobacter sp.]